MAVRVRISVKRGDKVIESAALLNIGFEAETAQLILPAPAGKLLGLWPPSAEALEQIYDTAGGPARMWVYPGGVSVGLMVGADVVRETTADAVISVVGDELLMSDGLVGELGIVIEDARRGFWRLRGEPASELRESERPQVWR